MYVQYPCVIFIVGKLFHKISDNLICYSTFDLFNYVHSDVNKRF